jgi:uncharacterized repeat protein (TIGR03803 family)
MNFNERRIPAILLFSSLILAVAFFQMPSAEAQTYKVLYAFAGGNDGANPLAGLTIDSSGNLYGAAYDYGGQGYGTVYELAPNGSTWTFSTIYTFRGSDHYDGMGPQARPVLGPNGSLYGTTNLGGFGQGCIAWDNGCGTVYSLKNNSGIWSETVLFQFGTANGGYPGYGDVVFDPSGNLYGTSPTSGTHSSGIAYELNRTSNWAESVLYNFQGTTDGSTPLNGPIFDQSGNLYGTTSAGGAHGYGTVYELSPSGSSWTETALYSFTNGSDGGGPTSNLVMDSSGNLYGATQSGGTYGGGTVFRLKRNPGGSWTFSTIYEFRSPTMKPVRGTPTGTCSGEPYVGSDRTLTIDSAGNLYGTTSADTVNQWGTVFKLTPISVTWSYTALHTFSGTNDGATPWGRLTLDSAGDIYGTAVGGGANGCGVIFEITPN